MKRRFTLQSRRPSRPCRPARSGDIDANPHSRPSTDGHFHNHCAHANFCYLRANPATATRAHVDARSYVDPGSDLYACSQTYPGTADPRTDVNPGPAYLILR